MSREVADVLGRLLVSDLRRQYARVYEGMWRELDYLREKQDKELTRAAAHGWSVERLRVVAVLNAFHRCVVSPLISATETSTTLDLGRSKALTYGRLRLDTHSRVPLVVATTAFRDMIKEAGIPEYWVSAARIHDVLYSINRAADGDDG